MLVPRRLAAIMFTDIVGFTRLGQRDEGLALEVRREHHALLRPLFAAHGGREVKTMGDGFLVEFASAVESVRCAVAIQEAVSERNSLPSSKERIHLRIGIHLGDVVEEEGDILGDAVNVASRIEPLAEPDGICVSGSVFDQVRNKVPVPLTRLGLRDLKNVEVPVEIYRVGRAADSAARAEVGRETGDNVRFAVLPFANMSSDASDEYFADGLTDELISQVSKIPSLRVIARTSVLQYKGSSKSLKDVARELGVKLALEGTVRKAGNQLRVTGQRVDTRSEEHLWSSRYERPLTDIFAIQDEIAGQIAASISRHLSAQGITTVVPVVRASAPTQDLEAYSLFLQGRKLLSEKGSEATIRQALKSFEEAVGRDPVFARARVGVAESLEWLAPEGAAPLLESTERSRQELERALSLDPMLAEAHSVLAGLLLGLDDLAGAEREARRAIELSPSLADPYRWLAQIAAGAGRMDETIRLLRAANQIDPVDANVLSFLARSYFYAGRTLEARAQWERNRLLIPFRTHAQLTEYHLGRQENEIAEEHFREMERLRRPDNVWTELYRGVLAVRRGDPEAARAVIARLDTRAKSGEMTSLYAGFVHYALGDMDRFVAIMEDVFRIHQLPLLELLYSPLCESARADPRIVDLLRRQAELGRPAP
ncbi:MAG: adenylate/guanylate cyclase domain-containing protein [Thermoplasmata archaeon]